MRIIEQGRGFFYGTHKGHTIQIDKDWDDDRRRFYIIVKAPCGMSAYDGWAPEAVTTMRAAKREAIRGACIDRPSPILSERGR